MAGQSRRFVSWAEFPEGVNREPARSPPGRTSSPPRILFLYRNLIRSVAVFRGQYIRIRQPVHTGYGYTSSSVPSSSYSQSQPSSSSPDRYSGPASAAAATAEFCTDDIDHDHELTMIARRMVSDGYAWRMVNALGTGGPDHARLVDWFLELDVDWVLQLHEGHGLWRELQDKSAWSLQELIERWIRALTVIAVITAELVLVVTVDETPAVTRFGQASMAKMLAFVDAIIPALKEEKLRSLLDMYVCVSSASYRFASYRFISPEAQIMLNDIGSSLSRKVTNLREVISSTMENVKTWIEDDDSWAILIPRGRGEVHHNTRLMVDCITSMVKAEGSVRNIVQSHDTANLRGLIDDCVRHLKDLLLRKSELCSDPSLRYMFLLNNFYYSIAPLSEPRPEDRWVLTPECKMFMDSYLDVSWGHVISHIRKTVFKDNCLDVSCGHLLLCVPKTGFHEWRQHRKKTSSLAKFESAFHKTYRAQKFWKVPDPQLRDALRNTIMERVISDHQCYLKKHPVVEKHVRSGPDVLKEMIGELFEGSKLLETSTQQRQEFQIVLITRFYPCLFLSSSVKRLNMCRIYTLYFPMWSTVISNCARESVSGVWSYMDKITMEGYQGTNKLTTEPKTRPTINLPKLLIFP